MRDQNEPFGMKALIVLGIFIWLISPSCYGLWQAGAPTSSSLLPPLSSGESLLLAPQIILDLMGYWFWPLGYEPLTITVQKVAILRQGLFYGLILLLVMRFCWRLRKVEPWLFRGLIISILGLLPFCGVIPDLVQPFSHTPIIFGGIGLALAVSALLLRAVNLGRTTGEHPTSMQKLRCYGWRFTGALVVVWLGVLTVNLFAVTGRDWEERLSAMDETSPDLVIAVEKARQLAKEGQSQKAESLIIRCGQAAPWYPEVPVVKAEMLFDRGEYEAAQVHLDRALELAPNHPGALTVRQKIESATASSKAL